MYWASFFSLFLSCDHSFKMLRSFLSFLIACYLALYFPRLLCYYLLVLLQFAFLLSHSLICQLSCKSLMWFLSCFHCHDLFCCFLSFLVTSILAFLLGKVLEIHMLAFLPYPFALFLLAWELSCFISYNHSCIPGYLIVHILAIWFATFLPS